MTDETKLQALRAFERSTEVRLTSRPPARTRTASLRAMRHPAPFRRFIADQLPHALPGPGVAGRQGPCWRGSRAVH